MSPLALGLDLGSSGLRLALVESTPQGTVQLLSEESLPYPRPFADPCGWREGLLALVARLDPALRARVGAIAIDGTSGTLLACRPDGSLLEGEAALALPYHLGCPEWAEAALALCGDPSSPAASASGSLARALRLLSGLGLRAPAAADQTSGRQAAQGPSGTASPGGEANHPWPGRDEPARSRLGEPGDDQRAPALRGGEGEAPSSPLAAEAAGRHAGTEQPLQSTGHRFAPAESPADAADPVTGHAPPAGGHPGEGSAGAGDAPGTCLQSRRPLGSGPNPGAPCASEPTCLEPGAMPGRGLPPRPGPREPPGVLLRHQADWLMGWLLGDWRWGEEGNNLRLGWDLQRQGWSGSIADQPWAAALPQIRPSGALLGPLCAQAAALLGLPPDCRVVAGSTDANAGVLAADLQPGDGLTVLGTTLVLKQIVPDPISAPGVSCHRVAGQWLLGGASNAGAGILRRFYSDAQIRELSRQIDPRRPSGLDLLPLPGRGERFPIDDPLLEPRLEPRPVSDALYLQALLEGLTDLERRGWQRLRQLGAPTLQRVITVGGGAVNPQWRALRQRALGVPVLLRPRASAAQGMARLALRATLAGG